jgi:hypothetical protein
MHSATPNAAAASYGCHQRRSGRVAASDKERQYRADFEKRIEEEDAAVEAEAAPSMEAQLQALRSQGPPPGMSPEDFEKEMAQYEQAMQDPAVRATAQTAGCCQNNRLFLQTKFIFMFHATSRTTLSSKMRSMC